MPKLLFIYLQESQCELTENCRVELGRCRYFRSVSVSVFENTAVSVRYRYYRAGGRVVEGHEEVAFGEGTGGVIWEGNVFEFSSKNAEFYALFRKTTFCG